jgi:hypothetical protein
MPGRLPCKSDKPTEQSRKRKRKATRREAPVLATMVLQEACKAHLHPRLTPILLQRRAEHAAHGHRDTLLTARSIPLAQATARRHRAAGGIGERRREGPLEDELAADRLNC